MASIALGLAGIGGLASSLIGGSAAKSAATTQANAANTATNLEAQQFNTTQANEQPWLQAGGQSLQQLMAGLAPGGSLSTPAPNSTFTAPTLAEAEQEPGYQFTQQQGDKAIEASGAASGGAFTGNTAEALDQYNQGLATTNYQNVYNNALNTFGTNFNAYNTNQTNLYNKLAGVSGLGQQTANELGQTGAQTANAEASTITGGAAATAAGQVGQANAITGGISNAVNGAGGYLTLQQLMQQQQVNNPYNIAASGAASGNATSTLPNDPGTYQLPPAGTPPPYVAPPS